MQANLKWVSIFDDLPEKYVQVLTLLYKKNGYEMSMNSIQGRHVRKADGELLTVYQWELENLRVEYWLDGLPKLPEAPKQENK